MYFVRAGDRAATNVAASEAAMQAKQERFAALLDPVWSQLARYARAIAAEDEAARDLLAEALALAWEHFDKLRDEARFKQYLFRIIVRLHYRAASRASRFQPIDSVVKDRFNYEDHTAERNLDVQLLYQAMEALPAEQREALMLFEVVGLSLEEVREVQGGSLSGVKSRLKRGRERLAKLLSVDAGTRVDDRSITGAQTQPIIRNQSSAGTTMLTIPLKAKL